MLGKCSGASLGQPHKDNKNNFPLSRVCGTDIITILVCVFEMFTGGPEPPRRPSRPPREARRAGEPLEGSNPRKNRGLEGPTRARKGFSHTGRIIAQPFVHT